MPIGHITNGVHVQTWLAPQMRQVYDRHLGPDWPRTRREPRLLGSDRRRRRRRAVGDAPDAQGAADRLRAPARGRSRPSAAASPPRSSRSCAAALSLDALTIGFARRFATYKRANLMLQRHRSASPRSSTTRRCRCSSSSPARRIRTTARARTILQQIAQLMRDPRFAGKLVFVEDYDINVGRHLVQGVDVWLNNPRRPLEACGTSGQKVVLNGGLNLSILDGWWAEAYDGLNGFAIGDGRDAHRRSTSTTRATRRRCCTRAARRGRPALLRPRSRRPAARLDRAHEARDPHAGLALQRRPDGDGLRAARPTSRRPAARAASHARSGSSGSPRSETWRPRTTFAFAA